MAEDIPIDINRDDHPGTIIVKPGVDIDMSRSPALRSAVQQANSARPDRLVIDLTSVAYMDSSGLATLVEAMRTAKAQRTTLIICGMQDRVRAIFQIARLDQFFAIVPTLEEALV